MATERTVEVTFRLPDPQVIALNRAAGDLKRIAATSPRSFLRVLRAGMRLQRAIDTLHGARYEVLR